MKRRRVLGAVAAALGTFGGCLDRARSAPGTATNSTDTTTGDGTARTDTGATTDYADVSVRDVTVTPELVAANSPDSIGTYGDRDEQFVVATVTAEGSPAPDPDAFALDADGETHEPSESPAGAYSRLWNNGRQYGEENEGWLAFRVPKPLDAEGVTLTWPGGEHALGEDAIERLSRPPTAFEVREFAAPDSIQFDEAVTVTLTVTNVGDADGTFVAAVNRVGPSVAYTPEATVLLDVAGGETATWEHTNGPGNRYGRGGDDATMRFELNWRADSLSRTVDVESE